MVRGFSPRFFYQVIFFCFCLAFACFYLRGGSDNDKPGNKTEAKKLKDDYAKDKRMNVEVFLKRDERVLNLTENAEHVSGDDMKKETNFSTMARKGTVIETLQAVRIWKSVGLHFSSSLLSKVKVLSKESSTISHSIETNWRSNGGKEIFSSENRIFQQNDLKGAAKRENFAPLLTQNRRNRRDIDAVSQYKVHTNACSNFTFTIKSEDEYSVWNNFSMKHRGRIYHYNEYRVTDSGLQVCGSSNIVIQQTWTTLLLEEKATIASNHCNASLDGFYPENFTLYRNLTVFLKPTKQSFTRQDYGVIFGHFVICSAKLSLSCNDYLVKVNHSEQYNVFKNYSLFYNKKMYNYREYRLTHDNLEICASNDTRVQAIWETRNSWEKFVGLKLCDHHTYSPRLYSVNKKLTIYVAGTAQYITSNDYFVKNAKPVICKEKLRPVSEEYTEEDLLMCNDSIIDIKYCDDYKVRDDFSLLYKNNIYDYTEYRALEDGIKICNSTDNFERSIWKLRNFWLKITIHLKGCNQPVVPFVVFRGKYTVLKDFRVRLVDSRIITKYDYGLDEGKLILCGEKLFAAIIKDYIAPLCAMALSSLCLLLLLIVYCLLPELRTLPGLNLMSLSFAFFLWPTSYLVDFSLHLRAGKVLKQQCAELFVMSRFFTYSILMNAAVNVHHLRKTFCGNTLVKSDENKWKSFLKYFLFSWGVPIIITIVNTVLVLADVLRFLDDFGRCVSGHDIPEWLAVTEAYGLPSCFMLYVIVGFILTGYEIHKKLKASSGIAQKSHIVRNRKNFVLLLKLSTTSLTTAISGLFTAISSFQNYKIRVALDTLAFLSCVYLGVTFVFTRKNYQLLKKKFFPGKNEQVN